MSSAPFHVEPPEAYNFAETQSWPRWIRRWERYRVVSGLDTKPEIYQINSLIYAMGDEADDILASLPLSDAEKERYEVVREALESHFVGRHNVVLERACFNRRMQEPDEPAEAFVKAVHGLAERCKFGAMKEELIRDRIVVGIRDARLSERLQRDPNLTLAKTVALVRQQESTRRPPDGQRGSSIDRYLPPNYIEAAKTFGHQNKCPPTVGSTHQMPPRVYPNDNKDGRKKTCNRCGRYPPHTWNECPARDVECRKCKKRGHFASYCRSQPGAVQAVGRENGTGSGGNGIGFNFLSSAMGGLKLSETWQGGNGPHHDGKLGVQTNPGSGAASSTSYQAKRTSGSIQKPGQVLCGPGTPTERVHS